MNESSGKAGKGFYPNTELGIDLKLMTKEPGRMAVGEHLRCQISGSISIVNIHCGNSIGTGIDHGQKC